MPSKALPNPVLGNTETGNPVRRSLVGSPLMKPSMIPSSRGLNHKTPANSPLDHPQRNSSTYFRDLDEKENGKDLNLRAGRVRSPTITNCTKNFMSPTISASSKIAMSPKKKVLIERNDPIRTSLSSSDLKTSSLNSVNFSESIQPTTVDLKPYDCNSTEASLDSTDLRPALKTSSSIPKASKTVTFIDSETKSTGFSDYNMFDDADLVNLDYRFKISPASSPSSCQILASLEEDPYMPPYDPKTNYLSPRPQFLHYRPNPRIERYLHEQEDGKRIEGSSLFDSFSDTEVTEETQSDSSPKSDEVSSDGKDKHEEEEEEDADHMKTDPCLIDINNSDGNSVGRGNSQPSFRNIEEEEEEDADHMKTDPCLIDINNSDGNSVGGGNSQPSFRNICKITALILLLCFAFSSVIHSTPMVNRVLPEESSFLWKNTDPYEIYQLAKSKYPELAENLWAWFNNAAAFAHGLISNFEEENHQLSPERYFNLSALQEDISVDGYFVFYQTHERINNFLSESELLEEDELLQENVELKETLENPDELEQEHEEGESSESELVDEDELLQENVELKEILENPDELEQKHEESESLESELVDEDELLQENVELKEILENPDELEQEHEESESLESELVDDELLQNSVEMENEAEEHSEIKENTKRSCEEEEEEEHHESKRHESLEELAEENGRSEFEVIETVITSQERTEVEEAEQGSLELDSNGNDVSSASSASSEMDAQSNVMTSEQVILLLIMLPPLTAAAIFFFFHSRRVKTRRQSLSSSDDKLTQIPSSRHWPTEDGDDMAGESWPSELSSFQKNHRRESLSSSMSTDSASYGSFTAYEKILTKHGDLEEEMVTPVRRSSRIKTKLRVDH